MSKLTQPAAPDSVREIMGWGEGEASATAATATKGKADSKPAGKPKAAVDDDDEFFNFES
jgi:hypothetical protein